MRDNFSVLMSLYIKEKPEYFDECMKSILANSVIPNEIVIVLDGPITDELRAVLNKYTNSNPDLFTIVPLETNQGLGLALREGILHCKNELIARMDTDDICRNDRFELQLREFENNLDLDICGSHIAEFDETPSKIVARRTVPLDDKAIKKYQKRRDGFNHVSVMFKKSSVLAAGNYQSCLLMEDTLLWANMFMHGALAKNIDENLVYVRIGKNMYERRGGLKYYKKYKEGRRKVYKTGFISWWDYKYILIVQFAVAILPNKLRGFVFKNILHR
jgi:glycosyltransferase involved in cell wall biosynthesis